MHEGKSGRERERERAPAACLQHPSFAVCYMHIYIVVERMHLLLQVRSRVEVNRAVII